VGYRSGLKAERRGSRPELARSETLLPRSAEPPLLSSVSILRPVIAGSLAEDVEDTASSRAPVVDRCQIARAASVVVQVTALFRPFPNGRYPLSLRILQNGVAAQRRLNKDTYNEAKTSGLLRWFV